MPESAEVSAPVMYVSVGGNERVHEGVREWACVCTWNATIYYRRKGHSRVGVCSAVPAFAHLCSRESSESLVFGVHADIFAMLAVLFLASDTH